MKNQKIFIFFSRVVRNYLFCFMTFLLILGVFWFVSFFYWLHHLPKEYDGRTAEAIIVLTGAKGRLSAGAKLLKEEKGDALLVSGVNVKLSDETLFKQMPTLNKNLKKHVSVGKKAINTKGNAAEAQIWMRNHNFQSAIIVTSNWHMHRALLEFQYIMQNKTFIAYPVLSQDQLQDGTFWYFSKSWLFRLLKEYCKLSMRKFQLKRI